MKNFCIAIVFVLIFSLQVFASAVFSDVSGNPYEDSILNLYEDGIVNGYSDGTYKPFSKVNRAELVKIVFHTIGFDTSEIEGNCFPDVKEGQWFEPYVCKAKELGIVKGYFDGLFKPGNEVSMVEAFKIAIEAFDLPISSPGEGAEWYEPYADFIHENNVFSKYSYLPNRSANRGEVAYLVDIVREISNKDSFVGAKRNPNSVGCGVAAPLVPPSSFSVDGVTRDAIVVVPASYDKNKPLSLVFGFHGRTSPNTQVRSYFRLEKPSQGQAIFVYPAGIKNGASFNWSDPEDSGDSLRDYAFFDVMLEEISSKYCVNMDEVYAAGHSLGAWFVNSLACARGDVLRAVGTLGGSRSNSDCSGPVAVMQWHNPDDRLAPFEGALTTRDLYLTQNQCSSASVPVKPFWGNCEAYSGCGDYSPVVFCPHNEDYDSGGQYYPHNWPKATGEEMWNFFRSL